MKIRVFVILAVSIVLGSAYWYSGLGDLVTLERVQENKEEIRDYAMSMKLVAIPLFALVYVTAVALSLPFAAILSLLAGFLFGTIWGTVVVVVSATLGATAIFLLARTLLGAYFLRQYGERIAGLNREIERNGRYHLLFLRLVPLVPFFVVNIAPAFTRMKLRDFVLATALGIIPGSFVYVNAGVQLGEISSTREIFSPAVLGSFALLGGLALAPVAWKKMRGRHAASGEDEVE